MLSSSSKLIYIQTNDICDDFLAMPGCRYVGESLHTEMSKHFRTRCFIVSVAVNVISIARGSDIASISTEKYKMAINCCCSSVKPKRSRRRYVVYIRILTSIRRVNRIYWILRHIYLKYIFSHPILELSNLRNHFWKINLQQTSVLPRCEHF